MTRVGAYLKANQGGMLALLAAWTVLDGVYRWRHACPACQAALLGAARV